MTEKNIKVSIIMPSLNVRDYIEECIESVIKQSLKEIEIICVDAGSDDGTLEILEEYAEGDDRIKLIHSDMRSYGHQVNMGISEADGEYIGIVETDDFIDEKMYETLYSLTDNASCDIVKSNFYYFQDWNSSMVKQNTSRWNVPINEKFTAYEYADISLGHPSIWAAIYKKTFLDENKITFMEIPGGAWVDNPFLYRTLLSAKSMKYVDEPFYYYRISNPDSSTNNIGDLTMPMQRALELFDVLEEYPYDENILINLYFRVFTYMREILNMDLESQKHEVFTYFKKAIDRMDEGIVKKSMTFPNKMIYNGVSSSSTEDSFSFGFLIKFIRIITKAGGYFNK